MTYTMASWSGAEVMTALYNTSGTLVYSGFGTRNVSWTTSQLTSVNANTLQYQRVAQHSRPITLNNGHILSISGYDASNQGWGGSWGNGYGVVVSRTSCYACNVVMSAMSFKNSSIDSRKCNNRSFLGFTASHEVMYSASGSITTSSNATLNSTDAFIGRFRFFVR